MFGMFGHLILSITASPYCRRTGARGLALEGCVIPERVLCPASTANWTCTVVKHTATLCPPTQALLVSPMRSVLCGHVFSADAIRAHIAVMKTRAAVTAVVRHRRDH
eukprot:9328-Heterococcus_DN1.PRE.4